MNHAGLAFAGFFALAAPVAAFDCDGVTGPAERAICASPAAKTADDAMNTSFGTARGRMEAAQSANLLADQRDWLKERNQLCSAQKNDPACYKRENENRTAFLTAKPEAGAGTPRPLVPFVIFRNSTPKSYSTQIRVFRFADAAGEAEKRFNSAIDKIVVDTPMSIDKEDRSRDTSSFYWMRTATIAYASDRFLSVVIGESEYAGGAHPNAVRRTINIDMQSGRILSIDDLLPHDKRADVVRSCSAQVASQLKDKVREQGPDPDKNAEAKEELKSLVEGSADGVASTIASLTSWTFGADAATVDFNPYAVAPYAYSSFDCEIPYAMLRPLVKPTFPLP